MRDCLAGAIFIFVCATAALAQPTGDIESIGFGGGAYRPGCWTPMVLKISPNNAPSGTYQIQVKQRDEDNDVAVFTRYITLTGSAAGGARDQRFPMLFIPQPINRGLPDPGEYGSLNELKELLEVYICTESGKQIAQLNITQQPDSVDEPPGALESHRGIKLVVLVSDAGARAVTEEYTLGLDSKSKLLGVLEDVLFVRQQPRSLPENVQAYDAVDAVVWLDGDPKILETDTGQRMAALRSWVRQGGHLIVSQEKNWQQTQLGFAEMLPVTVQGTVLRDNPEPLRSFALNQHVTDITRDKWMAMKGPFSCAVATPREDALVEAWVDVADPHGKRPFLARRAYGCGAVTWVAADLTDANTTAVRSGWANVWNRILDYRDTPIAGDAITKADETKFPAASGVDIGPSLLRDLQSGAKVGMYISLAVVFFVGYWLIAGPGTYLFLFGRRRTHLSWFAYSMVAIAATLLTVLLVKLLLRGPPELHHRSIVRGDRGDDGWIRSRFGLYIPRDGEQQLQIAPATGEGNIASISPLPVHPAHLRDREIDNVGKLSYNVPVRDSTNVEPDVVTVPYRSSLKEFEARWAGKLPGKIEGVAKVDANIGREIAGRLTNGTGFDLKNIYIAFKVLRANGSEDSLLYLPEWKAGITIDLNVEATQRGEKGTITPAVGLSAGNVPHNGRTLFGSISLDWQDYWTRDLRSMTNLGEAMWDDSGGNPRAIPMLTFFGRLSPVAAPFDGSRSRIELLRRGARSLDLSNALAAGSLVVVAEAEAAPVPAPLKVEGRVLPADKFNRGTVIYQFVLPVQRSQEEPATQPG